MKSNSISLVISLSALMGVSVAGAALAGKASGAGRVIE